MVLISLRLAEIGFHFKRFLRIAAKGFYIKDRLAVKILYYKSNLLGPMTIVLYSWDEILPVLSTYIYRELCNKRWNLMFK